MGTLFTSVYNRFLDKITDDMYMELTPQETLKDLQHLLTNAIPDFEFPRKSLNYILAPAAEWDKDESCFEQELTSEEIDILAILMLIGWVQRQITSVENTRMKYSGADFKMTSQANHLSKLLALLQEIQKQSAHKQRLYKRRTIGADGSVQSNWSIFCPEPRKEEITREPDIDNSNNSWQEF